MLAILPSSWNPWISNIWPDSEAVNLLVEDQRGRGRCASMDSSGLTATSDRRGAINCSSGTFYCSTGLDSKAGMPVFLATAVCNINTEFCVLQIAQQLLTTLMGPPVKMA